MTTRTDVAGRAARRQGVRSPRAVVSALAAVALLAAAGALVWLRAGPDAAHGEPVEEFMHVHGVEVPPWSPDTLFLATHHGLIRIDQTGWRYVSAERHDFMAFSAHPGESAVLFSSGHPAPGSRLGNPIGFMVSVNGGVTWETRALEGAVDFHAMAVGAGGAAIYGWNVAGQAGLYRSVDEGHTWETIEAPALHAAGGVLTLAAHPEDPAVVLAGTEAGLLGSGDAGRTWAPLLGGVPVTAVAIDPAAPDRLLSYAPPPGEGLVESGDGGQTWTPAGWVLDGDAVAHLAIHPNDPALLFAGTYGEDLFRSRDGGDTWETLARSGTPESG